MLDRYCTDQLEIQRSPGKNNLQYGAEMLLKMYKQGALAILKSTFSRDGFTEEIMHKLGLAV